MNEQIKIESTPTNPNEILSVIKSPDTYIVANLAKPITIFNQLRYDECLGILKRIERHNGAFGPIVNVYNHSMFMKSKVSEMFPKLWDEGTRLTQMLCEVHDFCEVALGDIPYPATQLIGPEKIHRIEVKMITTAIEVYYEQKPEEFSEYWEQVKKLDFIAAFSEVYVFGGYELFESYIGATNLGSEAELEVLRDVMKFSQGMEEFYTNCK